MQIHWLQHVEILQPAKKHCFCFRRRVFEHVIRNCIFAFSMEPLPLLVLKTGGTMPWLCKQLNGDFEVFSELLFIYHIVSFKVMILRTGQLALLA